MRILLLCTAHNSLSQRLYLTLSSKHNVTIEFAVSPDIMIEAATMFDPHLVICPFLTSSVPAEVFEKYMTLVIHPGAPSDGGPSALDFVIMGEDGTVGDLEKLVKCDLWSVHGRSHWGITVLQAIAEYDAGPVWAFEQFRLDIDSQEITKSSLYRGEVTRAAIAACMVAIARIETMIEDAAFAEADYSCILDYLVPALKAKPEYKTLSITGDPFLGGHTQPLPLLRAAQRDFDINRHSAKMISRFIRASDSQPGCLTTLFTPNLYIYGGLVEDGEHMSSINVQPGSIIGTRNDAVCFKTVDGKGIWITHARQVKKRSDATLWPKVPALSLFLDLGLLNPNALPSYLPLVPSNFHKLEYPTFQEISIQYTTTTTGQRIAYLTFEFYNGAMSTNQCHQLALALRTILNKHISSSALSAVVLLGGSSYFSNGIDLNVIEAAKSPAYESWANINAIDDVVLLILQDFAAQNIVTVSAIRGNAAAGGVALAAAADIVLAGEDVVLNPAYRALGLFGSEYHTLSYPGRVGQENSRRLLQDMLPISALQAREMGLVDVVIPGYGKALDTAIHSYIDTIFSSPTLPRLGGWKQNLSTSPTTLAAARMRELAEMAQDFWSFPRCLRYHSLRSNFVRKVKVTKTPLRFAMHRRRSGELLDEDNDMLEKRAKEECEARQDEREKSTLKGGVGGKDEDKTEVMFSCYYGGTM
jgi:enoyl-CoA hydratase/carnithine racemase